MDFFSNLTIVLMIIRLNKTVLPLPFTLLGNTDHGCPPYHTRPDLDGKGQISFLTGPSGQEGRVTYQLGQGVGGGGGFNSSYYREQRERSVGFFLFSTLFWQLCVKLC